MKVKGSYEFEAPRELVWEMLLDPDVLANTLPGVEQLEKTGENDYRARMKIRIGPVQGVFNGTVKLSDLNPPNGCHLSLNGKGAPGFVKGTGEMNLEEQGNNTLMTYSGEAQVGGRLASVGQRLMESSTQALLKQSLESLETQINARVAGDTQPGESVPVEPPSELKFAAGMTLKMLEDMIPADERKSVVVGVLGSLALIILSVLIGNWWMDKLASRVADKIDQQRSK